MNRVKFANCHDDDDTNENEHQDGQEDEYGEGKDEGQVDHHLGQAQGQDGDAAVTVNMTVLMATKSVSTTHRTNLTTSQGHKVREAVRPRGSEVRTRPVSAMSRSPEVKKQQTGSTQLERDSSI